MAFSGAGDAIALVGPFAPSLAGSELAKLRGELDSGLPGVRHRGGRGGDRAVREAVRAGSVSSAHDVSDGGLACALAECAIAGGLGCRVDLDPLVEARGCSGESALFGEGPGGFVAQRRAPKLEAVADRGVEVLVIGEAGGEEIGIGAAELSLSLALSEARSAWESLAALAEPDR